MLLFLVLLPSYSLLKNGTPRVLLDRLLRSAAVGLERGVGL